MKFLLSLLLVSFAFSASAEDVVYTNPKYKQAPLELAQTPDAATIAKQAQAITAEKKATIPEVRKRNNLNITNYHTPVKTNAELQKLNNPTIDSASLKNQPKIQEDCESVGNVCLTSYVYEDKVLLTATNKSRALRTLTIQYVLNNMRALENSFTKNIVLRSGETKKIETLIPEDRNYSYTFNYSYESFFGVIDAVHDDNYEYDLPFDTGEKFFVIQGVGGSFSHAEEDKYYSYDFKMPIGTPVMAARDGIVVQVKNKYVDGGVNPLLKNKDNSIYIQHSDGTIAIYAHLKANGALVKVGDKVQQGQKIALSGNTGYTTTPHLHFGVFKVIHGGKHKSIPVSIRTKAGLLPKLEKNEYYER